MQSLNTRLHTHMHTPVTQSPPSRFLGIPRSHTHSVTLQDQKCVRCGDPVSPRLIYLIPAETQGKFLAQITSLPAKLQGTVWAGQQGLRGSERFPWPGEGAAGSGAGSCPGLCTHSPTLGVPGHLRPLPWEPFCPHPSPGEEGEGYQSSSSQGCVA